MFGGVKGPRFPMSLRSSGSSISSSKPIIGKNIREEIARLERIKLQNERIKLQNEKREERRIKREKAIKAYAKINKITDSKIEFVTDTIFDLDTDLNIKPLEILPPEVQTLIRQRSEGMCVRNPLGTTSCRHLQMLFLLYTLAYCITQLIGINDDDTLRKILSKLWHNALEQDPELKEFYGCNDATVFRDNQKMIILADSNIDTIFDGRCIFPMGLIKSYALSDGTIGYRIFHYFILLIEGERHYIYNANGSDTLRAHPMKIEITLDEFKAFINHVNRFNKDELDLFILTYFMEGATTPFYFDEGCNRTKTLDEKTGKLIELKHYTQFQVAYFPELREQLIGAAGTNFSIDLISFASTFGIVLNSDIETNIQKCVADTLKNDCEQASAFGFGGKSKKGKRTKKRPKRRTKKNKRLKLKTRSFSKRLKR